MASFQRRSDAVIELSRAAGMTVNLTDWLTIKRYAERNGLTTQVVTNWIARGIIPADCTMVLPELNDIWLVKNRQYR